jgi:hypothetical protein
MPIAWRQAVRGRARADVDPTEHRQGRGDQLDPEVRAMLAVAASSA